MNRTTVRIAALVLAAGVTLIELFGIGLLAGHAGPSDGSVVVLPHIVVTPTGAYEAEHPDGTWIEAVESSPRVHAQAANQARN